MSSKAEFRDNEDRTLLRDENKSNSLESTKAVELEYIRQNLAKRSLDAKFDLQGSDYKPIENIGVGAYGVVCSAVHTKSGDRVAIKKIPSVFEALSIAKRTYREIKILKHFKHDNIISIREILIPAQNVKDFKDIYVVFDLMESDLHRIIYSKQELSEEHIRYFLYQILRGLKYIHSANVIHRDLKPSNVLVNEDCHLRIGDFGMARGVFYTPDEPSYYMTQYVATRWYRAPEILLSMLEYGAALDMWSVGCIFAEMMGRKHLFPGKDYISQVKLIVGVLGSPSESVLKNCHHDILKKIIKNFGKREPISWEKLFPKASKKSLDLVSKMLMINPADRISVDQALSHRLLNNYHDPSDEPICVPTFNFDFEKEDMDKLCLRSAIMEEIMSFHQPKQPTFSFNAFLRPAPKSEETITFKELKADAAPDSGLITTKLVTDSGSNQKGLGKEIIFETSGSAGSKPSSKVSPVSVDIGKLQLIPSADIEMLSAQSTDGRAMDTQHAHLLAATKKTKEEEKPVTDEKKVVGEKDLKISADKKAGNTISEDTKALVKQALMNATQRRQRAESQGDDSKDSKPITAAQRQKEREERRRKKKERALEKKVKKSKEKKQPPSVALSSQDMELLRRWTVMQNPGQGEHTSQSPPHPGPAVSPPNAVAITSNTRSPSNSSNMQNVEVTINSQQNTCSSHVPSNGNKPRQILAKTTAQSSVTLASSVSMAPGQIRSTLFPSSQLSLSQANFIPVIAIPSFVKPGQLEIKRIFQPTSATAQMPVTTVSSSLHTSDNAKAVLHTAILMRNRITSNTNTPALSAQNVVQTGTASDIIQAENVSPVLTSCVSFSNMHTNDIIRTSIETHDHVTTSTAGDTSLLKSELALISKDDKLSPHSQGNDLLEFLHHHLKDSPREKSTPGAAIADSSQSLYLDQNHCMQEQNSFMLARPTPENNEQHSLTPPPPYSNYSQACNPQEQLARSNSTPSLLRQNSHSPNLRSQQQELRQRSSVPVIMCRDHTFSNFPVQVGFTPNFQPVENIQPNFPQSTTNFQSSFISIDNYQDFSQNAPVVIFDSQMPHADILFQSSSDFSHQMQHQQLCDQVFESVGSYSEFNSFPSSTMSRSSSSMQYIQSFSGYSQSQQQNFNTNQGFQAAHYDGATGSHSHIMTQQILEPPLPQPSLHSAVAGPSSGTFTSSLLQRGTNAMSGQSQQGTSHPGHRLTVNCSGLSRVSDSNTELIALLTKQLSKQHVMDIVPSLALTPRGTGAGYGVGMDLDAMLTDAQDNAGVRAEQSPLSSSLLADWLDISENISQADLEALERELAFQSPMHVSYDVNL